MSGNSVNDKIRNEEIHLKIRVTPIDEKMRASSFRSFGYVHRRAINELEKVSWFKLRERKNVEDEKIILIELVKMDMSIEEVRESMTLKKIEWRKIIHVVDFN